MPYCRYCGVEITYKRTKNEKWVPCDFATGQPHFCQEDRKKAEEKGLETRKTGISPCPKCGKPTFLKQEPGHLVRYDYTTLSPHRCLKADAQKFARYKAKRAKLDKLAEKSVPKAKPAVRKARASPAGRKPGKTRAK